MIATPVLPLPDLPAPLAEGQGHFTVRREASASTLTRARARAPLKLVVPRYRGLAAWVYAATFGGGLVEGDRIALDVDVGPGAAALLATQASTKVYRSRGRAAEQGLVARVSDGALLAVLPEPITCFTGAIYRQRQQIDLAKDGSLLLFDGLTSGRAAREERWCFSSFQSMLEIRRCGARILRDAFSLQDTPEAKVFEHMGRFDFFASLVAIGPALTHVSASLLSSATAVPSTSSPRGRRSELLACASPIDGGVFVRIASESVERGLGFVREAVRGIASELGEDPWSRKF